MKHIKPIVASLLLTLTACSSYEGPQGKLSTLGKASVRVCKEMVYPDGANDPNSEAIGFDCVEAKSDHLGAEAGVVIEAGINAVVGIIPGLPVAIKWFNGLGK